MSREIYDPDIPRVDAVDVPATGIPFLILKGRDIPERPAVPTPRDLFGGVAKKDNDPDVGGGVDRDKLPDSDFAGPDRSFPIVTPGDVQDAASSLGRAKGDKDAIKRNIIRIAHEKGQSFVDKLPEDWKVSKAADAEVEPIEGEDEQGAHVDGSSVSDADANEAQPGDPAWEAVDAAKARTITDALVAAREELKNLAAREQCEPDDADYMQWCHLMNACDLLDCAVTEMAVFAVNEQQEAENALQLATAAARSAGLIKSLNERMNGKEAAPVANDTKGAPAPEKAPAEAPVAKAADDDLVAVYTADGKLLGAVDPEDLTPLSTTVPADAPAATDGDAPSDAAPAAAPADGAAAPVQDAAPAQAAPAQTVPQNEPAPADANAATSQQDNVAKDAMGMPEEFAKALAKVIETAVAAQVEPLAKANASLSEKLETLQRTPRAGGPLLNGQVPGGEVVAKRGDEPESNEQLLKRLGEESDSGARMLGVAELIRRSWNNPKV